MIRWSCIDFSTLALNGSRSLSVSNRDFRGIAINANRNKMDTATKLLFCLNCEKKRPMNDMLHTIGADLWNNIAKAVNRAYVM